jgi:hypothetical protein
MDTERRPIKPGSILHRLLKMIAEEVAKEFSAVATKKERTTSTPVRQPKAKAVSKNKTSQNRGRST